VVGVGKKRKWKRKRKEKRHRKKEEEKKAEEEIQKKPSISQNIEKLRASNKPLTKK